MVKETNLKTVSFCALKTRLAQRQKRVLRFIPVTYIVLRARAPNWHKRPQLVFLFSRTATLCIALTRGNFPLHSTKVGDPAFAFSQTATRRAAHRPHFVRRGTFVN